MAAQLVTEVPAEEHAQRLKQSELPARGVDADATGDLGDALARGAEVGVDVGPLWIRHLARGVVGLHGVVDERVERVLLSQVLEEVLLPPPLEHPVGHLDGGQVAARRDDGRLMAAVGEPGDLAQAQPPAEEPDPSVGEPVGDALAVEDSGARFEAPLWEVTESAFTVSKEVEARVDERSEELRAPPAADEDDSDAALSDERAHLAEDLGEHRHHAGVGFGGDHEERLAAGVV